MSGTKFVYHHIGSVDKDTNDKLCRFYGEFTSKHIDGKPYDFDLFSAGLRQLGMDSCKKSLAGYSRAYAIWLSINGYERVRVYSNDGVEMWKLQACDDIYTDDILKFLDRYFMDAGFNKPHDRSSVNNRLKQMYQKLHKKMPSRNFSILGAVEKWADSRGYGLLVGRGNMRSSFTAVKDVTEQSPLVVASGREPKPAIMAENPRESAQDSRIARLEEKMANLYEFVSGAVNEEVAEALNDVNASIAGLKIATSCALRSLDARDERLTNIRGLLEARLKDAVDEVRSLVDRRIIAILQDAGVWVKDESNSK